VFSTAEDNQNAVTIRVFQGERELAAQNKILGQFDLVGIPPAPRGMPQVEVTFDIDANGIVNVSAKDKATNKEQQIRIQASGGLSQDEIERMVREAAENAEEDKKRKAVIEAKNQADSVLYQTEKSLKEYGDHLSGGERAAIDTALADLKSALETEDADRIKAKTETLQQASMKLGEAMYKASQAQGGGDDAGPTAGPGPDTGSTGKADDGVVDAEFEEVDDNKKRSA
jgi:molecular chaperone DnaK